MLITTWNKTPICISAAHRNAAFGLFDMGKDTLHWLHLRINLITLPLTIQPPLVKMSPSVSDMMKINGPGNTTAA